MHKFLFPLAAGLAIMSGAAYAADLSFKPPQMVVPAPETMGGASMYFTLHGGALWLPSVGTDIGAGSFVGDTSTKMGYRVGGSIGYDFNSSVGAEAEVSYGNAGLNAYTCSIGCGGIPSNPALTGSASLLTVMGNLVLGTQMGAFHPYVGVGAGAADVFLSVPDFQFGPDGLKDNNWTWAAQAFVGVDFALTKNVSLGGRYRYQYIGPTKFMDLGDQTGTPAPVALDGFGAQSIEAVLKVRFGG